MRTRLTLLLLFAPALHAAEPADTSASSERRYVWLTQGEPSGSLVTRVDSNGRRQSEFTFNDRGRGPKITESATLDASGVLRELHVQVIEDDKG